MSYLHAMLKTQTEQQHRRLEANPLIAQLLAPTLDCATYQRIITHYYSFHQHYEPAIASWIKDFSLIPKADWLYADLLQLGSLPQKTTQSEQPLHSKAEAIGALYVLEGATLGGQVILRTLKQQLPQYKHRFFSGYGKQTAQRWRLFLAYLSQIETTIDAASVVDSANNTFQALDDWMRN
ncbi:MAG: biliverdin-producing heme oxygenase [Chloroflexota bacterium]